MQGNSTPSFGRRGVVASPEPGQPRRSRRKRGGSSPQMPRLAKQMAGIATGVAVVVGILLVSQAVMRQVGREMDAAFERAFDERMQGSDPRDAIQALANPDPLLLKVHARCEAAYDKATLKRHQEIALPDTSDLAYAETQTAKAAAYITCLTQSTPERFCRADHREHLVAAVDKYLAHVRHVGEQWDAAIWDLANPDLMRGRNDPLIRELRHRLAFPSVIPSPQMLDGIRSLMAAGYITPGDFGGFAGYGVPDMIMTAAEDVQAQKADCR